MQKPFTTVATLSTEPTAAKPATPLTAANNRAVYDELDFADKREIEFANRGFIDAPERLTIKDESGKVVWSQNAYDFTTAEQAPVTVNPSLWRNTQLNHCYGLFQVTDGIYQVRGYDMANITFVSGDTGWIVFDPLMSVECARAAFALVEKNFPGRPVKAVVISHPHLDHYGGIKGIVDERDIRSGKIPLIVPEGFEESAVSENLYAGAAMGRRAGYQYGTLLTPGATGNLSIGIGIGQSIGLVSYISPTDIIKQTGEKRTIDGVMMEFQMTPGTEAPAEMNTYFPQRRALWLAENCTATLHNLYTLRGAQVRDGNAWSKYIMEALSLYVDKTDVVFQSHNWPHWGNESIREYMINTAAVYKFINDQTLNYINQGYTAEEIAYRIKLPEALARNWYTRQYYGTVAHNAKAVYQKYMGWYDANPVNLHKLPPEQYAKKLVEYIGDEDKLLELARRDFDRGDYQWVAEITNAAVFKNPANTQARNLCADALEQLGYQAESGPWRNVYLSGAKELREGTTTESAVKASASRDMQKNMTTEMMLDYLGILIDSNAAKDQNYTVNLLVTDTQEQYLLTLRSGVLLYQKNVTSADAVAALTTRREGLFALLSKNEDLWLRCISVTGQTDILRELTRHIVAFPAFFPIVEP